MAGDTNQTNDTGYAFVTFHCALRSMTMKLSAGILMYKVEDGGLKVLLVHPGGPFFATKDVGAWSIPKGEYLEQDDPVEAAIRELEEETGATVAKEDLTELGVVRQKGGKLVSAWCARGDFDVSTL